MDYYRAPRPPRGRFPRPPGPRAWPVPGGPRPRFPRGSPGFRGFVRPPPRVPMARPWMEGGPPRSRFRPPQFLPRGEGSYRAPRPPPPREIKADVQENTPEPDTAPTDEAATCTDADTEMPKDTGEQDNSEEAIPVGSEPDTSAKEDDAGLAEADAHEETPQSTADQPDQQTDKDSQEQQGEEEAEESDEDDDWSHCKYCNVDFKKESSYYVHIRGIGHFQQMEVAKNSQESSKKDRDVEGELGEPPKKVTVAVTSSSASTAAEGASKTLAGAGDSGPSKTTSSSAAGGGPREAPRSAPSGQTKRADARDNAGAVKSDTCSSPCETPIDTTEDDDWSHCQYCNVNFKKESSYYVHIRGIGHFQQIEVAKNSQKSSKKDGDVEACELGAPPKTSLPLAKGSSQSACGADKGGRPGDALHNERRGADGTATLNTVKSDTHCSLCDMSFGTTKAIDQHFKGKYHLNMVTESEGRERMQGLVPTSRNSWKAAWEKDFTPDEIGYETPLYYCDICRVSMCGFKSYDMHMYGAKHVKKAKRMGLLKERTEAGASESATDFWAGPDPAEAEADKKKRRPIFIQKDLDECLEPVIGLDYITELRREDVNVEPCYVCDLCKTKMNINTVLTHIVGARHRIKYFKFHSEGDYDLICQKRTKSDKSLLARQCAQVVENLEGRHKIRLKVERGMPVDGPAADADEEEAWEEIADDEVRPKKELPAYSSKSRLKKCKDDQYQEEDFDHEDPELDSGPPLRSHMPGPQDRPFKRPDAPFYPRDDRGPPPRRDHLGELPRRDHHGPPSEREEHGLPSGRGHLGRPPGRDYRERDQRGPPPGRGHRLPSGRDHPGPPSGRDYHGSPSGRDHRRPSPERAHHSVAPGGGSHAWPPGPDHRASPTQALDIRDLPPHRGREPHRSPPPARRDQNPQYGGFPSHEDMYSRPTVPAVTFDYGHRKVDRLPVDVDATSNDSHPAQGDDQYGRGQYEDPYEGGQYKTDPYEGRQYKTDPNEGGQYKTDPYEGRMDPYGGKTPYGGKMDPYEGNAYQNSQYNDEHDEQGYYMGAQRAADAGGHEGEQKQQQRQEEEEAEYPMNEQGGGGGSDQRTDAAAMLEGVLGAGGAEQILKSLGTCQVITEADAEIALQVSSALTKAILDFRRKSLATTGQLDASLDHTIQELVQKAASIRVHAKGVTEGASSSSTRPHGAAAAAERWGPQASISQRTEGPGNVGSAAEGKHAATEKSGVRGILKRKQDQMLGGDGGGAGEAGWGGGNSGGGGSHKALKGSPSSRPPSAADPGIVSSHAPYPQQMDPAMMSMRTGAETGTRTLTPGWTVTTRPLKAAIQAPQPGMTMATPHATSTVTNRQSNIPQSSLPPAAGPSVALPGHSAVPQYQSSARIGASQNAQYSATPQGTLMPPPTMSQPPRDQSRPTGPPIQAGSAAQNPSQYSTHPNVPQVGINYQPASGRFPSQPRTTVAYTNAGGMPPPSGMGRGSAGTGPASHPPAVDVSIRSRAPYPTPATARVDAAVNPGARAGAPPGSATDGKQRQPGMTMNAPPRGDNTQENPIDTTMLLWKGYLGQDVPQNAPHPSTPQATPMTTQAMQQPGIDQNRPTVMTTPAGQPMLAGSSNQNPAQYGTHPNVPPVVSQYQPIFQPGSFPVQPQTTVAYSSVGGVSYMPTASLGTASAYPGAVSYAPVNAGTTAYPGGYTYAPTQFTPAGSVPSGVPNASVSMATSAYPGGLAYAQTGAYGGVVPNAPVSMANTAYGAVPNTAPSAASPGGASYAPTPVGSQPMYPGSVPYAPVPARPVRPPPSAVAHSQPMPRGTAGTNVQPMAPVPRPATMYQPRMMPSYPAAPAGGATAYPQATPTAGFYAAGVPPTWASSPAPPSNPPPLPDEPPPPPPPLPTSPVPNRKNRRR